MADRWNKIEDIIENFCQDIAAVGPQYAALCAVNDSLFEQSASEGVGLQNRSALHQIFANMLHTAARENDWSIEDIEAFLDEVVAALRTTEAFEGFSNLSPML